MMPALEIAIGAFFLAIGTAGPPLKFPRIVLALLLAAIVWRSGRFLGAVSMLAVIAGGYLQHSQFRLTTLVAGAAIGIAAHLVHNRPPAATIVMGVSALAGVALLFLG